VDAKQRHLACFLNFYVKLYGHDNCREWFKSVTEAFLKELARGHIPRPSKRGEGKPQRLSQSTIARTYGTVRHFARWIHKHVSVFPLGCPTDGVKVPEEEEPKWKGLSRIEQLRLLTAAQALRIRKGRGTDQGLRDRALIAALLGTGLRVSELLVLDVAQYNKRGFVNVLLKAGTCSASSPSSGSTGKSSTSGWRSGVRDLDPSFSRRAASSWTGRRPLSSSSAWRNRRTRICRRSNTMRYHPTSSGIRSCGKSPMKKVPTTLWSSPGIGATDTSGGT
jgi:hypothetical protein